MEIPLGLAHPVKAKGNARTIGSTMESTLLDFRMYPIDHDPDNRCQPGFYQLTTPLRDLPSIPVEPFAKADGLLIPGIDELGWELGCTGPPRFIAHRRPPKVNSYGLASFGPDVHDSFPGGVYVHFQPNL
jgi:hypothetical protein